MLFKSTIFKTIKDEITGVNKSIGIFGLSLSDLKNKLNDIKANGLREALFNSSLIDERVINDYNQKILDGASAEDALTEASKNANQETIALMRSAKGAIVTNDQLTAAQKASTIAAKAQSLAMGALKTAANVGIAMLATLAASALFNFIITKIDEIVNRTQKIKEAAAEAKTVVKDIKSEFDSLKSSTENVGKKFAELAQGVENLGEANQSRGKLSTEDYDEFLDLSNQLAELYPQLTKGYDDNGNAILNLSGNVDAITGALTNLLNVQQKIANQQILEKLPDVWAGYDVEIDEYEKKIKSLEKTKKTALDFIARLSAGKKFMGMSTIKGDPYIIQKAIKNIKLEDSVIENHGTMTSEGGGAGFKYENYNWDFGKLTDTQLTQLKNELGRLASEYQDSIDYAKSQISSANLEMSSYINSWLSTEWNFAKLDSSLQDGIKNILINFDWTKAIPENVDSGDWEAVSNWLSQDLLYAIQNINSDEIKQLLSKAFSDALSLDEIQKLIDTLKNNEGFDENNPLVLYCQAKIDTKNELIKSAKTKLYDEYKDKVYELSDEDLEIASERLSISDDTLLTWDELKQKIQEVKNQEKYAALANKDYADSLAEIKGKTDEVFNNTNLFKSAAEKQKKGESLSYDEVMDLVALDPSIAEKVQRTADGYSIAVQTLTEANKKYIQSNGVNEIRDSINQVKTDISDYEKKIKSLEKTRKTGYIEIRSYHYQ